MKCEKCGNEYPSAYYFATPTICSNCFSQMTEEEKNNIMAQHQLNQQMPYYVTSERKGFGIRLGASLLDLLILMTMIMILLYFSGFFDTVLRFSETIKAIGPADKAGLEAAQMEFFRTNSSTFFIIYIISFVYYSLEILVGASLGKIILGLQIGNENGKPANYAQLTIRYLIKNMGGIIALISMITMINSLSLLGTLTNIIILVGFFFVLGQKRQAFHDLLARTAVYRRKDLMAAEETNENV